MASQRRSATRSFKRYLAIYAVAFFGTGILLDIVWPQFNFLGVLGRIMVFLTETGRILSGGIGLLILIFVLAVVHDSI